ncbi:site-specific DNA-methyltransferase [Candidatus Sumerlaeota bacterium]|nr:site-specific DNA-methyltransferase [Candidatus Sumerlaeota bacterium]
MSAPQLKLSESEQIQKDISQELSYLLSQDLDFHNQSGSYSFHNFHSFPAKFPPQLPRKFIESLTIPGEIVLDPMMGSGTTVLEAYLLGRYGIGCDIDPLALLLTKTKITPLNSKEVSQIGNDILKRAKYSIDCNKKRLEQLLHERFDEKTHKFVDYWFAHETQLDLLSLIIEIERIENEDIKAFFQLAFSSIIITKSGGVSLSLDLAHTRPHRAKVLIDPSGEVILGSEYLNNSSRHNDLITKRLRSPIKDIEKRIQHNIQKLNEENSRQIHLDSNILKEQDIPKIKPNIFFNDVQKLSFPDNSVDLIVTSPPYSHNAIDYMRAHKFSLVWFGYSIESLSLKRKDYIGGESTTNIAFESLPPATSLVVDNITTTDKTKGRSLHRYYSEMKRALIEMFRVLKSGKAAIIVVGNSIIRNHDTRIPECLSEMGESIGFQLAKIAARTLDRNRRMLPAGSNIDRNSQIQQRMHKEYVIGLFKP